MSLAHWAVKRRRAVLIVAGLLALVAGGGVRRLGQADDLLDFVPPGDADVRAFREVSHIFGALQVAIIGVEAPPGEDVFAPQVIARLARLDEALRGVRGVDRLVSLTTLPDFQPSEDAVQVVPLVDGPPSSPAARAALRAKVMARHHVVGSFVSTDGRSAVVLVYLAGGVTSRAVAAELRSVCDRTLDGLRVVYGGAPFAGAAIYEETQADIRRLTPLALLLILLVVILSFRDLAGVAWTVATVAWGTWVVIGAMGWIGEPFTVVSAMLPVILFASGSSYAVHVLGRYFSDGGGGSDAIARAADTVAAPVAIAGATTAAGFLSFLAMDIRPMRAFGLESAAGILLCTLAALVIIPAAIAEWPRGGARSLHVGRVGDLLAKLADASARHRWWVIGGAFAVGAVALVPMLSVEVRMEPQAFFRPGSEPWKAERFLDEKFGGSQFIEIDLKGDVVDPATLYEIERLTEFARAQPGVTQVAWLGDPLALVNEAMGGGRRLPETRAQVQNLLFFIEGEPSVRSLLTPKRDEALVHVRVRAREVPAVLSALERYVAERLHRRPTAPSRPEVAERIGWVLRAAGSEPPAARCQAAVRLVAWPPAADPIWSTVRREEAAHLLGGEAFHISDETRRQLVERAVAGEGEAAWRSAAASPEEGGLAWQALEERVRTRLRERAIAHAADLIGARDEARRALAEPLGELLTAGLIAPGTWELSARLAGEPVLDRGFSRSVGRNQLRSLVVSFALVVGLMFLLFRSAYLAAISVIPSALAMAIVFGAMGASHIPIDISTSLVASIATGAGSDFAMHYLWYLRRFTHREVVRFVGPVMVLSTLLVAAGFAVLSIGRAQPMRMFGSLAAASLTLAAALTFLLVPPLLRRVVAREEKACAQ